VSIVMHIWDPKKIQTKKFKLESFRSFRALQV
jgi:hypothetical protein